MSTAGIVLYSSAQQLQTPIRVEVALLVCVNRVQLCFLSLLLSCWGKQKHVVFMRAYHSS